MVISKGEFTKKLTTWLMNELGKKYPNYQIDIVEKPGLLSKSSNPEIKKIDNYSFLEFEPDIIAILEHKTTKKIELVLLNRELKTYGIREIGEMLCFCRLVKPLHAFMVSLNGLSPDVNKMINHEKNHDIISYDSKTIKIFRWNEKDDTIDKLSMTPIESTSLF